MIDEDEVDLKEQPEDTRYINKIISSLLAFWLSAHMHTFYIIYNITFQLYTGILF